MSGPSRTSPTTSGVATVQDEGSNLTARTKLNFTGAGVTATDNAGTGATDVSISGAGVSDASTTVKGVTKLSKAPVSASNPIALGVNDERTQPQGRTTATPTSENLTGTLAVAYVGAELRVVRGPLTGDVILNSSGAVSGSRMTVLAVQGATPRAITIDGNAVPGISQTNGVLIRVEVEYVDVAGTITPHIVATTTETDPNAVLKSLGTAKGDTVVWTASGTPAREAVGGDGTIIIADSTQTNGRRWAFASLATPFTKTGAQTVSTGAVRFRIPFAAVIETVAATVGTAPTGASLIVDVNKNGTTIFTTQANRPTIAAAGNASSDAVPDITAVAAGDYITVDVDQIGSTVAGSDLCVILRYHRT